MARNVERARFKEVASGLGQLLGAPANLEPSVPSGAVEAMRSGRHLFRVAWKGVGDALRVGQAIQELQRVEGKRSPRAIPLVAVPYMGEVGQRLCEEAGLSWIDLSGNASIDAPGLRVRILGQPNRFKDSVRPGNVFAPRNSRVVRALLLEPESGHTQAELARGSGLDKGRVSRIVRQLEKQGHLRKEGQAFRCVDALALLDAWREAYDFDRYRITRGIVGGRSAEEIMQRLARALEGRRVKYAITGLAGAWLLTEFAMFRTITALLGGPVEPSLLAELRFQEEPRGANVWLAVPDDDGPFVGSRTQHGIVCAHPLQVYLDLKGQPERASEAAAELRQRVLFKGSARG